MDELRQAREAVAAGDKSQAYVLLAQLLKREPTHVAAWFELSGLVDKPSQQMLFLRRVLTLDPGHEPAQARLLDLEGEAVAPDTAPATTEPDVEPGIAEDTPAVADEEPAVAPALEAEPVEAWLVDDEADETVVAPWEMFQDVDEAVAAGVTEPDGVAEPAAVAEPDLAELDADLPRHELLDDPLPDMDLADLELPPADWAGPGPGEVGEDDPLADLLAGEGGPDVDAALTAAAPLATDAESTAAADTLVRPAAAAAPGKTPAGDRSGKAEATKPARRGSWPREELNRIFWLLLFILGAVGIWLIYLVAQYVSR